MQKNLDKKFFVGTLSVTDDKSRIRASMVWGEKRAIQTAYLTDIQNLHMAAPVHVAIAHWLILEVQAF